MLIYLVSVWAIVALFMLSVWTIYLRTKNPGIIDVAWVLGSWLSGSLFLLQFGLNTRIFILETALTIWALRLAGHLYLTRIRKGIVDKRYIEISNQWQIKKSLGFLLNYQLQGFLLILVTLALYFTAYVDSTQLTFYDLIGLILIGIGIIGESISDITLYNFTKKKTGKVCDIGLWQYSRHPNYFFEWLVWLGFSITSLAATYGYFGLISPLALFIIMTKVTGPITEAGSLDSKGELYLEYQRTTPMFFPWFKKRG